MAGSYASAVNRLKDALVAHLAELNVTRIVTRTYKDPSDRPATDLRKGIYTIRISPSS